MYHLGVSGEIALIQMLSRSSSYLHFGIKTEFTAPKIKKPTLHAGNTTYYCSPEHVLSKTTETPIKRAWFDSNLVFRVPLTGESWNQLAEEIHAFAALFKEPFDGNSGSGINSRGPNTQKSPKHCIG